MSDEKTKHTPGPWEVASPDHDQLVIVAASGTDDAEDVAVLFAHPSTHPNAPANAAVMAAAPELLAALKRMDAMLCAGDDFSTREARHEGRLALIQCRAAIAKAEGRS